MLVPAGHLSTIIRIVPPAFIDNIALLCTQFTNSTVAYNLALVGVCVVESDGVNVSEVPVGLTNSRYYGEMSNMHCLLCIV